MLSTIGEVATDAKFNALGENALDLLIVVVVEPLWEMPNRYEEVERSVGIMRVSTHT